MNHEQITQLLKDYRSYRYAVMQYERHQTIPQAGVANYSGMPGGSGAPELFFANVGRMADYGSASFQDQLDYNAYRSVINAIDGAVMDVLTDGERTVVMRKYLDREPKTLTQIAQSIEKDERTVRRYHKEACRKLRNALALFRVPAIINLDVALDQPA